MRGSLVKILFFIFIMFSFITLTTLQNINAEEAANTNKIDEQNPWFKVKEVAHHVWCIKDYRGDNMYLVVGEDSALLIDTGIGVGDLKSCVRSITNLPLLVVNTHGHHDHVGGNFQFSIARANPEDFELINKSCNKENHDNRIKKALLDNPSLELPVNEELKNYKPAGLMMIKAGFTFDLGKRKLVVIETPGHTKGSICLVDADNKLLFAGDNDNPIINWLFLETCLPLEIYLHSLERLKLRADEFDTILPGHGDPVDKGLLDEQIICAKNIISGNCQGESYKQFSETALKCSYKRATIAYDPNNLFEKKKL